VLHALLAFLLTLAPRHGTVRTDSLWSQSLATYKHYVVYLPPSYAHDQTRRYPVAYYLHGLFGNERNWVDQGHLDAAMDSLIAAGSPEMIVVMPDGDDGWYTTWNTLGNYGVCVRDSTRHEPASTYCVRWPHYDDYIARDLVAHVDSVYRTIPDRRHRAIAGLSMGGYGAVALALEYPKVWSAAASHSGVLSPLYDGPHPFVGPPAYATSMARVEAGQGNLWRYMKAIFGSDLPAWRSRDPIWRLEHLLATEPELVPALFIDVGRDDGLADENRAFDAELTARNVPHQYAEWPGAHTWMYWRAHVGQSLAWIARHIAP
jgi:S-formylglutathione hydrolase FrmB